MSLAPISAFFTNKVNIQLKSGQRFEGLLRSINYKTNEIVLEDVEDLGNQHDKNWMPHDKKIPEKTFESENINEIFMKEKHFSEPKKYKKEEFWDAISEPQQQKQRKYKPKFDEQKRDYRPKKNFERDNERNERNDRVYKPKGEERNPRKEEKKEPEDQDEQERGLR